MINYIGAELYRIIPRKSYLLWGFILLLVVPLVMLSALQQYDATILLGAIPGVLQIILFILALVITEFTLREDMSLRILKNDMNLGLSRKQIYVSKFFAGVLLLGILGIMVCTAFAIGFGVSFSLEEALAFVKGLFTGPTLLTGLLVLCYLAAFQLISLFVTKVISILVITGLIQMAAQQIIGLFPKTTILNRFLHPEGILQITLQGGVLLALTILLLLAGCRLFERKEL